MNMSLCVTCGCGKSFRAPPTLAGKTVKCPACGSPIAIPLENEAVLNAELVPLASSDPLAGDPLAVGSAHDPLGLGNFDERTLAASPRPMRTQAPPRPQTQPKHVDNQALTIGLIIGGCVVGGLLVIGVLIALLLPAVHAARKAAQRVQEENARRYSSQSLRSNAGAPNSPRRTWRSESRIRYQDREVRRIIRDARYSQQQR